MQTARGDSTGAPHLGAVPCSCLCLPQPEAATTLAPQTAVSKSLFISKDGHGEGREGPRSAPLLGPDWLGIS